MIVIPEWQNSGLPILFFESDPGWPTPRKQRLFAVACCRRIWHLLPDGRWHDCLVVAERFADRRAKRSELIAARPASTGVTAYRETYGDVVRRTAATAIRWACETTRRKFAGQVSPHAASAAAYATLPPDELYVPPAESIHQRQWMEADRAELAAQIALVYEVCGELFHSVHFSPEWRTATVMTLARQMYDSGEFGAMPILADALQDAGCDNEDMLSHCRDPKQVHVRGCWVVDLVLEKE